jgi:hypothetical protein
VALISQTMLKQPRHLLPNLLDISDLKNDKLDCGFWVIIHNNNLGGSISSHHNFFFILVNLKLVITQQL